MKPAFRFVHLIYTAAAVAACPLRAADDAPPAPAEVPAAPVFEGAVGLLLSASPEYSGAKARKLRTLPGFYLRYGRYSVSNAGGFVTRRKDDVVRGLGIDLSGGTPIRTTLALRIDNGRRSSSSGALSGIDDVRRTLRLRAVATLPLGEGWKLGAGLGSDLLGRGGGQTADLGLSHERTLGPGLTWSAGGGLVWASSRYMQSWYGVTPEAAQRSGYAAYAPGSGLREVSIGTGLRHEFSRDWIGFADLSASRLLGPARRSPLTTSPSQWQAGGGLAWRF